MPATEGRTVPRRLACLTLLLALALPSSALAGSAAPDVTTGGVTQLQPESATLNGIVNPKNRPTTYFFQYGKNTKYGSRTPDASAGSVSRRTPVSATITGLTAATTYHYRLVAHNSAGTVRGGDRSFKTPKVPLALSIGAAPNPVAWGTGTTISGVLSGTGNGGQPVVLQQRSFPFATGFANVGNPVLTNPDGTYQFTVPPLASTTQYQVVAQTKPPVTSPTLIVNVAVVVSLHVSTTHPRKGENVRFSGSVRPPYDNTSVSIQKQKKTGGWVTVARALLHHGSGSRSAFVTRHRVRRGGNYRALLKLPAGPQVTGASETRRLHVH
jgi:hypothetical protein